jgi:E3 ubiquitin-protein ligase XIAP/baculoviral IAP repeat-containing protein 7/8
MYDDSGVQRMVQHRRDGEIRTYDELVYKKLSYFSSNKSHRRIHRREAVRLDSFDNSELFGFTEMVKKQFAKDGFFYVGYKDLVQCIYCGLALEKWDFLVDVISDEHNKWSPNCPFKTGGNVCNIELTERTKISFNEDDRSLLSMKYSDTIALNSGDYRVEDKCVNGKMALFSSRLQTFRLFPPGLELDHKLLAGSGFYYLGHSDVLICYFCSGSLYCWQKFHIPFEEHFRWFPFCKMFKKSKVAMNFVTSQNITEEIMENAVTNIDQEKDTKQKQRSQAEEEYIEKMKTLNMGCKICFDNIAQVTWLPCGHLYSCVDCIVSAPLLKTCSICRSEINAYVKVFV